MRLVFFTKDDYLRNVIRDCQEEEHVQQVVFSTFHNALTQVCFTCDKVRTTLPEEDLK